MRNEMEAVLKENFRELVLKTRYKRNLIRSKMSKALVMSEDIERGKTVRDVLTVGLLLTKINNPIFLLNNLRKKLEKAYEMAGASV